MSGPGSEMNSRMLWHDFQEYTSAHGVRSFGKARGTVKRLFWTLIALGSVGVLAYNLTRVFEVYFRREVVANVHIQTDREAVFPAVTVCNMSPVKQSAIKKSPALKSFLESKKRRKRNIHHSRTKRSYPVQTCTTESTEPTTQVCFTLYDKTQVFDYDTALKKCQEIGMTLAQMDQQAMVTWQNDSGTLAASSSNTAWIGLRKVGNDYVWTGSRSKPVYKRWMPGQPANAKDCVTLDKTKDYEWKADFCTKTHLALCSGNLGATTLSLPATTEPTQSLAASSLTPGQSGTTTLPGSRFKERIQTRDSFQKEERFTEILADLPEDVQWSLGFTQGEFILHCQYDEQNCDFRDFTRFYNTIHGNCYTFNSGWNITQSPYKSRRVGHKYGLSLILNINQEEYVEDVGDVAGARVVIHDQDKMPFPEDEGLLIAPGFMTSVGMRRAQFKRMPYPFGDCFDHSVPRPGINVYEEKFPVKYSSLACYKTCYQRHVIQRCGCADSLVPKYGQAFSGTSVSICDIENITQDDCRYEVDKLYRENIIECKCPPACRETVFHKLISRSLWPSDVHRANMEENLFSKFFQDKNETWKLEGNLVKLDVFYTDFRLKHIDEERVYGWSELLSDIGGLLGLLAGFSVVTIVEIAQLLMNLIVLPLMKRNPDVTSEQQMRSSLKETTNPKGPRRRNSYRPAYIKSSSLSRHNQYADLFDLNHD